ncbi:MAG: class I SAM-dependent methyltransferase [Candidatus Micrarchaeota archaeon]|nr:class I SAM-dependent methyltransferase [Candidatus Micrarchaeota archaeon]
MSEVKLTPAQRKNNLIKWNLRWKKEPHMLQTKSASNFLQGKSPDVEMLEMGCGNLGNVEIKLGPMYHGVDISIVAIKAAHRKNPKANFIVADASFLPFRDNAFKKVISYSVIEFLGVEFREAFKELVRVTSDEISFSTMHLDVVYKPKADTGKEYIKLSYGTVHIGTGLVGTTPEQMMAMLKYAGIEIDFKIIDKNGKDAGIDAVEYLNGLDINQKKNIVLNARKSIIQEDQAV